MKKALKKRFKENWYLMWLCILVFSIGPMQVAFLEGHYVFGFLFSATSLYSIWELIEENDKITKENKTLRKKLGGNK